MNEAIAKELAYLESLHNGPRCKGIHTSWLPDYIAAKIARVKALLEDESLELTEFEKVKYGTT